jgi:hypothetical protein
MKTRLQGWRTGMYQRRWSGRAMVVGPMGGGKIDKPTIYLTAKTNSHVRSTVKTGPRRIDREFLILTLEIYELRRIFDDFYF